MEKSKTPQKGAVKPQQQQRPGTEQVQSGTHLQKGQAEHIQAPKQGQQKQPIGKQGKKGER